jgi:hypothetical protein
MALLDFETALGRIVRAPKAAVPLRSLHLSDGESASLQTLRASAGFRLTVEVQHSWCIGRASRAVPFTLSILPEDQRRRLLDTWTDAGGGTTSFFSAEGDALLEFIASHLPDPSHELTACRFEQATLRANEQADAFTPPDVDLLLAEGCLVRRGRAAGMAEFHGEPHRIIGALVNKKALPPISAAASSLLFGPGLVRLHRIASPREVELWKKLHEPLPFSSLLAEGYDREDLAPMITAGILECYLLSGSSHRRFGKRRKS